jgi:hypothetical protein
MQWLKTLKSHLEELPSSKVSRKLLEETEEIPTGEDLDFAPPKNFQIAGSYLLRSIAKPNLNIGLQTSVAIHFYRVGCRVCA